MVSFKNKPSGATVASSSTLSERIMLKNSNRKTDCCMLPTLFNFEQ